MAAEAGSVIDVNNLVINRLASLFVKETIFYALVDICGLRC